MTARLQAARQRDEAGEQNARRAAMAVYARASVGELSTGLKACGAHAHQELRPAETGLVMVRGRIGGDGAPFNLGEATVTRAAVQVASGAIGFSYVFGRDREKARLAALADALWQSDGHRGDIERHVLAPVRARLESESRRVREEAAATRVNFFTLVRGED